mmetsp:Transcript_111056/g.313242  ORF Transcript_111056/g.313242 Transcript_111056/m.313242 type:complete len:202 (-) Transcript_111056:299-904(-)
MGALGAGRGVDSGFRALRRYHWAKPRHCTAVGSCKPLDATEPRRCTMELHIRGTRRRRGTARGAGHRCWRRADAPLRRQVRRGAPVPIWHRPAGASVEPRQRGCPRRATFGVMRHTGWKRGLCRGIPGLCSRSHSGTPWLARPPAAASLLGAQGHEGLWRFDRLGSAPRARVRRRNRATGGPLLLDGRSWRAEIAISRHRS